LTEIVGYKKRRYNPGEEDERNEESLGGRSSVSSNSYGRSWRSNNSENRLSTKEVNKLRKMILDKEKKERKNNIVIKGANPVGDLSKWVQKFLKDSLEVDYGLGQVKISRRVVIVKLGSEERKREIMQKKNKLCGGNIFIENDLTWEERKSQREIRVWAKQQRAKGKRIKIGYGKIRVNGEWKY